MSIEGIELEHFSAAPQADLFPPSIHIVFDLKNLLLPFLHNHGDKVHLEIIHLI